MRYEYRRIGLEFYDKHHEAAKRRRGKNVDRMVVVKDSALDDPVIFPDHDGDDRATFLASVSQSLVAYMNKLGSEGWQLVDQGVWITSKQIFTEIDTTTSYLFMRTINEAS